MSQAWCELLPCTPLQAPGSGISDAAWLAGSTPRAAPCPVCLTQSCPRPPWCPPHVAGFPQAGQGSLLPTVPSPLADKIKQKGHFQHHIHGYSQRKAIFPSGGESSELLCTVTSLSSSRSTRLLHLLNMQPSTVYFHT